MIEYLTASLDHFLSAFFLGFVPVIVTSILVIGIISLVARNLHHFPYSLGFSVLGGSLGLLLGASREPVVQAFLPAIVTLISGLLVLVVPKSDTVKKLAMAEGGDDALRNFVVIGLAAMLLSSTTTAFWGGSIRSVREQDDRRYAEWHEIYQKVRIPLMLETQRKNLGLSVPQDPPVSPEPKP